MTHIAGRTTLTSRELIARSYTSDHEDDEGARLVYLEIHNTRTDETEANINVSHSELLAAIGSRRLDMDQKTFDELCNVIDAAKNDDVSADTDEYASRVLMLLGMRVAS